MTSVAISAWIAVATAVIRGGGGRIVMNHGTILCAAVIVLIIIITIVVGVLFVAEIGLFVLIVRSAASDGR